jgi:hypothetical protein
MVGIFGKLTSAHDDPPAIYVAEGGGWQDVGNTTTCSHRLQLLVATGLGVTGHNIRRSSNNGRLKCFIEH